MSYILVGFIWIILVLLHPFCWGTSLGFFSYSNMFLLYRPLIPWWSCVYCQLNIIFSFLNALCINWIGLCGSVWSQQQRNSFCWYSMFRNAVENVFVLLLYFSVTYCHSYGEFLAALMFIRCTWMHDCIFLHRETLQRCLIPVRQKGSIC